MLRWGRLKCTLQAGVIRGAMERSIPQQCREGDKQPNCQQHKEWPTTLLYHHSLWIYMESIDTENAGNDIDNLQATDSFAQCGNLFRDPVF